MILLFAFGTATAMVLPIVTAILGLVSALAIIRLLGHVAEVPSVAPTLATMIGLGVGIDYALFIVTRHKLQLQATGWRWRSRSPAPTATAGGAVAFAGSTVVIALCSLALAGIPLVTAHGLHRRRGRGRRGARRRSPCCPRCWARSGRGSTRCGSSSARTHPDDHEPHGWRALGRGRGGAGRGAR